MISTIWTARMEGRYWVARANHGYVVARSLLRGVMKAIAKENGARLKWI